jgi:hypothetical protein
MKTVLVLLCSAAVAYGQTTIETTVGGDQTFNAYGLQTGFTWHNLSGWTGVGYNNGVKVGGYLRVPISRSDNKQSSEYHLDLGDKTISADLDTDDYTLSHNFSLRGGGMSHSTRTSRTQIYSGLLLEEFMLPYMHTGNTVDTVMVVASMQRKLSSTVQMHSLNSFDGKTTSIQSIGWRPNKTLILAGAGGIGEGSGYGSASIEYLRKIFDGRVSYTAAGDNFQRQQTPHYSEEALGLNARTSFSPIEAVNLFYAHDHDRTNVVGYPSVTATSDSASLSMTALGFTLVPGANKTTEEGVVGATTSESVSLSKAIMSRWTAFGSYINMNSPIIKEKVWVVVNEFRINPRLMVTQDFSRMDGDNSYSFGGQWTSNRISVSAEQEVYTNPIGVAYGSNPIFQAWTVSIRLRLPHGSSANVGTIIDPTGKVQWGGYVDGLRYSSIGPQRFDDGPSFSKYVVTGEVVDEATGLSLEGIAIQIGNEIVTSNASGVFYLDVKNTKSMPIKVLASYSTQPLPWRLVSAPPAVQGRAEAVTAPIRITVSTKRPGESGN